MKVKKLNSYPAIYVDELITKFTKDVKSSNPMAKTLLSQLSSLVVLIDKNEAVQDIVISILNEVKESWNGNNT